MTKKAKLILLSMLLASSAANAQLRAGIAAVSDSLSKSMDRQIELENQKELLRYQYQLEDERRARHGADRQPVQQALPVRIAERPVMPVIQSTNTPPSVLNMQMVASVIPNWLDVINTRHFEAWADRQTRFGHLSQASVYNLAGANPGAAVAVLRQYMADSQ